MKTGWINLIKKVIKRIFRSSEITLMYPNEKMPEELADKHFAFTVSGGSIACLEAFLRLAESRDYLKIIATKSDNIHNILPDLRHTFYVGDSFHRMKYDLQDFRKRFPMLTITYPKTIDLAEYYDIHIDYYDKGLTLIKYHTLARR